jgi:hypothetical protein
MRTMAKTNHKTRDDSALNSPVPDGSLSEATLRVVSTRMGDRLGIRVLLAFRLHLGRVRGGKLGAK